MANIEFHILLRKPQYPVIILSADRLYSANNIKQLAESCVSSIPMDDSKHITVVDSTGTEFWYSPEEYILTPGFSGNKWTKKKIIELFNNSTNAKISMQEYSLKSLPNKRVEKIIGDICELLQS